MGQFLSTSATMIKNNVGRSFVKTANPQTKLDVISNAIVDVGAADVIGKHSLSALAMAQGKRVHSNIVAFHAQGESFLLVGRCVLCLSEKRFSKLNRQKQK